MNPSDIERSFEELRRTFHSILESDAPAILAGAKSELITSKREFDAQAKQSHHPGLEPSRWGYAISPHKPLRFKVTEPTKGFDVQIDVSCQVKWNNNGALPAIQDVLLRLWHKKSSFRAAWDNPDIEKKVNASKQHGRVMLRYHFDLANTSQPGPKFHLQAGGNADADELCWFPELINLPRLAHPPMDLILVCQLIAANFFPKEYKRITKDPQWNGIVITSQTHLLKSYYEDCLGCINNAKDSLLDHLWNK